MPIKECDGEATFFVLRSWKRWRNLNENHQDEFPINYQMYTSDSMLNYENVIETDSGQPRRGKSLEFLEF